MTRILIRHAVRGLVASTMSVFILGQEPANAEACPRDLTSLAGQILTPGLAARLDEPLDAIVQRAGGLDEAIARTQAALANLEARRASLAPGSAAAQAVEDGIVIYRAQLAALRCRQ